MTKVAHLCKTCGKADMVLIAAKCGDLVQIQHNDVTHVGNIPEKLSIGGGDYIRIAYCASCLKLDDQHAPTTDVTSALRNN